MTSQVTFGGIQERLRVDQTRDQLVQKEKLPKKKMSIYSYLPRRLQTCDKILGKGRTEGIDSPDVGNEACLVRKRGGGSWVRESPCHWGEGGKFVRGVNERSEKVGKLE